MSNPQPEVPKPKKRRQLTKGDLSVKNMVWAIGLNLAIVAVIAVFVAMPRDNQKYETPALDINQVAAEASGVADFPVVKPSYDDNVKLKRVNLNTNTPVSWNQDVSDLSNRSQPKLVQVKETKEFEPAEFFTRVKGVKPAEKFELGTGKGETATCQSYAGADSTSSTETTQAGMQALVCTGSGWALAVNGETTAEALQSIMQANLDSLK